MSTEQTQPDQPTAEPQGIFGGRLGSGVADARDAAAGAAELVANAQRILTELEKGERGLTLTVGPFTGWGIVIPEIPIRFRLTR